MKLVYFKTDTSEPVGFACTSDGRIDFSRLGLKFGLDPTSIGLNGVDFPRAGLKSESTWEQIEKHFQQHVGAEDVSSVSISGSKVGTSQESAVPVDRDAELGIERVAMDRDYIDKRIREIAEEVAENRPNKIARRGTAFTSIAVGDVDEEALWKAEVQETCVSCRIVDVDELLVPERALVADLRYLQLLSVGRTTSLFKVVEMKRQRLKQAHDLERCYYSPALTIMQASVAGQQEVLVSEDYTKGAWRDLVYVNNEECPSVMKAINGSSNDSTDPDGIHSNKAVFGKLLKIIRTKLIRGNTGSQTFICTFWNRIECIWFVKFEFEANDLKEVLVAPRIPAKGLLPPAPICDDLDSILDLCKMDRIKDEDVKLSHLLPPEVPLGFRYMTRHIDTLCALKGIPIDDVVFETYNGDIIDMREARIIARGGKSLILQVGEEHAVIKVGPRGCIELEYSNHKLVDGHVKNIRCMVDRVHGVVEGMEELGFIKLQGLGRRICVITWEKLEEYWTAMETALSGLHRMELLHRDVKLENMLLIDEQLVLFDFDVSCRSNDSSRLFHYVGTENFRSPFWKKGDRFIPADDWVSLGLSFVSLKKLPAGDNPLHQLQQLVRHQNIPEGMREKLNAAMESSKARGETVRDPSHCTERSLSLYRMIPLKQARGKDVGYKEVCVVHTS